MSDDRSQTTADRSPIHLDIECHGNTARCSFVRNGQELLWVELPKDGCRRWGEAFLEAASRLEVHL